MRLVILCDGASPDGEAAIDLLEEAGLAYDFVPTQDQLPSIACGRMRWVGLDTIREGLRSWTAVAKVEACELDPSICTYHYVVVRSDLPIGTMAAMVLHAAGETGPAPEHTRAVVLAVHSEFALRAVSALLPEARLGRGLIVETEGEYVGQMMAIGLPPCVGRRPELSHLPLLRGLS